MSNPEFVIRPAAKGDEGTILNLIKELAVYEKLTREVTASEEDIRKSLFEEKAAEAFIGEFQGKPVGFCLFFHNYSTFMGKKGLYLEDLFVLPEYRGKGFGKKLLARLAKIAVERNCGRFEWSVLDWNEPAINFYKSLGSVPMDEWTVYRLAGKALTNAAELYEGE